IGPYRRAMAMTSFCVALQLMLHAGHSVLTAFRLAFSAADNKAFLIAGARADAVLRRGNSILDSLRAARIFPEHFLGPIGIGEASGHVPEVLRHQADYYRDLTRRRMTILNRFLSSSIWLGVAAFVISLVIRIYSLYVDRIGQFTSTRL